MNIKENTLFKLEASIFDDKFNIENLHLYQLSIYLDKKNLNLFVYNTENKRALLFEKYAFQENIQDANSIEVLESIFNGHSYLNAGFWKGIKILFKSNNFTFIPNTIFDASKKEAYLKLCTEYNESEETVLTAREDELNLSTTFSIDAKFLDFFENKYPAKHIEFSSHIHAFIKTLTIESFHKKTNALFVFAQDQKISIVKFNKEELQYANIFDYRSSEDLTYYTMLVINELGLNPDIINITMWGNMDVNSLYFKRLSEYVKNITLGNRPEALTFGYVFDEINEHGFYELLGSSL